MASGRVRLIEGDIRDAALVDRATDGVDYVFHQAALRITRCAENPREAVEVLMTGTLNVLEAAVRHKVKKVVAASSASVYGNPSYLPMDEAHPFNNRTLYGAGKIANEQMLRAFYETYKLPYVAFRYFNVYGSRMDLDGVYTEVLVRWMDAIEAGNPPQIFGDGNQSMDFVYVEDVARANLVGLESDVTDEVFNVGTGIQTNLNQLCSLLLQVTGSTLQPVYREARKVANVSARQASTQKAERVLGFTAQVQLGRGATQAHRVASIRQSKIRRGDALSAMISAAQETRKMIPVARPYVGREEEQAVAEVLRSGWLSQGPRVAEFEQAFSAYVGAQHSVAVSSCTTALHLAVLALGIGPGDEVICPSFSFIATANSIVHAGATPVFVDIDPETYNLDPLLLEQAITPRTRAILLVHQVGLPAALDEILEIAGRHGLPVIEDAACAIGSAYQGRRIGSPRGQLGLLQFPPAEDFDHRRRWHDHDRGCGSSGSTAEVAPTRHERVRRCSSQRQPCCIRTIHRSRLQLSND